MFVVTRKCQESVVVGGDDGSNHVLKITVLEIGNGQVKLGFDADPAVRVHGTDLWNDFANGIWHRKPGAGPVVVPAHSS